MKFGDKLYQLRTKKGLSQEELGNELNVTRQTVSKWELGQTKPDTDKLMEICKLLDVDINQLADDEKTIENDSPKTSINTDELKPRRWLLVLLLIIAIIITIVLLNKLIINHNENKKNEGIFGIFNIFDTINNQNKEVFNYDFEMYDGTNYGATVSNLIDKIIENNKKNKDHIIELTLGNVVTTDSNEIKGLKNNIKTWDKFETTIDYNEEGYINKISIQLVQEDQTDKITYNSKFENKVGSKNGISAGWILDDVITNNKTKQDHLITVVYNELSTTNPNEIKQIKISLDDWSDYELSLEYDENGYVNKLIIEDREE